MTADQPLVLTRAELEAAGVTRSALEARLRTGRWQRVFPRVYVTHSGQVTTDELLAAALAYAGVDAALSHGTAAALHRLVKAPYRQASPEQNTSRPTVHVTVADARRVLKQPGLMVHSSRYWPAGERTRVGGLACTTPQRTVLDLARQATTAGDAADVVVNAVGSRRTTSGRIRELAESWPPFRHRGVVLEILTEAADGAHSPLELRHARICRVHALPVGERQHREVLRGRIVYADDYLEPCEIVTELDGRAGHEGAYDTFRDMNRDNANADLGRSVIRLGWRHVLDLPCEVADQRLRRLRSRNWHGPVRPCGPGCPVGR